MQPFWLALQFLTRFPVPEIQSVTPLSQGRSVVFYPLVGLLIGAVLFAFAQLDTVLPPMVLAAALLILWVGLTGALHIDGLADMADAWVGGLGDRERTLEIMKDPRSGPMGITAVVLLLLFKFVVLLELLAHSTELLVVAPLVARSGVVLLMLTTPYSRQNGLASEMMEQIPRHLAWLMLLLVAVAVTVWLQIFGALLLGTAMVLLILFRRALLQRLNGFTGDTAGALIEILEVGVMLTALVAAAIR